MLQRHVLYVTQYYLTQAEAGGQRHYQHVQGLLQHGDRVTVITSYVHYQSRSIPAEYQGKRLVIEDQGALRIIRTYSYPGYGRDFLSRMRNYLSFAWNAFLAGLRVHDVDVLLVSSPPLFLGMTGWALAKLRRIPFIFEVRDLWPETAVAMGFVRNRQMIAAARWLEKALYRSAKRLIALTQGIRLGIVGTGINPTKVAFIPNGADLALYEEPKRAPGFHPLVRADESDDSFVAIFAGVHSTYSSLETLVQAAGLLQDQNRSIRLVLVGEGDRKPALIEMAQAMRLNNIVFLPQQPKSEIPGILAAANCCILPYQRLELFRGALPNKTFDYLASARPIVAAVLEGELTQVIKNAGAGLAVEPEAPQALADALVWLSEHPGDAADMGEAGRRYVVEHYDRRRVLHTYINLFDEVCSAPREVSSSSATAGLEAKK